MTPEFQFQLDVAALEVARGHDGLFRGHPEPVVVVGVYVRDAHSIRLLGRSLHRFAVKGSIPCMAPADVTLAVRARLRQGAVTDFVVLAIAMEEDAGEDIQRVYGLLEDPAAFSIWHRSKSDVTPLELAELPRNSPDWRYPAAVEAHLGNESAASSCRRDKWIGCVAWVFAASPAPEGYSFRSHFRSADGKNDWTAIMNVWSQ